MSCSALLDRAVNEHRAGRRGDAERLYQEILAEEPDQADALNLLGVLCAEAGRLDEAAALLERAVRARPGHTRAHYNLGNVHREQGALAMAQAAYETALELDRHFAPAWFNLGATHLDRRRRPAAVKAFRCAVRCDPSHGRARQQLALLLDAEGASAEAAAEWATLLEREPDRLDVQLNLGVSLSHAGRTEEAVEVFRDATRLHPQDAAGWSNLGGACRTAGRATEAMAALEHALTLDPRLLPACRNLALAALDAGEATAALAACRRAVDIDGTSPLAHRTSAAVLVAVGELAAAREHLETAARLAPGAVEVQVELAEILRRQRQFAEAEDCYRHALALREDAPAALAGRIQMRLECNQVEDACAIAGSALDRLPRDPAVLQAAAAAELAADRPRAAADLLRDTTVRSDLGADQRRGLLFTLARALDRGGEHERAWAAAVDANRLHPRGRFDRRRLDRRIDRIMDVFTAPRLAALARGPAREPGPVFIAGVPRSGSTLIEQILDRHPALVGTGEPCVLERVENRLPQLTGLTDPYPDCVERFDAAAIAGLADFAATALAEAVPAPRSGPPPRPIEKSLSNGFYLGLAAVLFPAARIIICRRDRRDAGVSCFFQDFQSALPWAYDLEDIAAYSRGHQRLLAYWQAVLEVPIMIVDYEQLVRDRRRVTAELLSFCGVSWDEGCLSPEQNDRPILTASADQVRRPVHARSIGRHRPYAGRLAALGGDTG